MADLMIFIPHHRSSSTSECLLESLLITSEFCSDDLKWGKEESKGQEKVTREEIRTEWNEREGRERKKSKTRAQRSG